MVVLRATHTPLSPAQLELVAERFRALGVVSRLRVLNALLAGPLTMSELTRRTGLQQSNLSRQVTELERAGCVGRKRMGREVLVRIDDPTLAQLCELVCGSLQQRVERERRRLQRRSSTRS